MRARLALVLLVFLTGCASAPKNRYWSMYSVEGHHEQSDGNIAEQRQIAAANQAIEQSPTRTANQPFRLIRAPQPIMSPEDTDNRVTGKVVADIVFSETGEVESIDIVESSKESLAASVKAALQHWRITPATRDGRPTKVRIRQPFAFRTDW